MYQYESGRVEKFNINSAYVTIAAAAALFRNKGRKHIWIYFKDGELHLHPVRFPALRKFYIAHFRCQALLSGLSDRAWNNLGQKLARKYFESK